MWSSFNILSTTKCMQYQLLHFILVCHSVCCILTLMWDSSFFWCIACIAKHHIDLAWGSFKTMLCDTWLRKFVNHCTKSWIITGTKVIWHHCKLGVPTPILPFCGDQGHSLIHWTTRVSLPNGISFHPVALAECTSVTYNIVYEWTDYATVMCRNK